MYLPGAEVSTTCVAVTQDTQTCLPLILPWRNRRERRPIVPFLLLMVLVAVIFSGSERAAATDNGVNAVYLPFVNAPWRNDLFGVQVYGETLKTNMFYEPLINTNTDWIRATAAWNSVEPTNTTPDNYDWTSLDSALAAARPDHGGFKVIATIRLAPDWAARRADGPIDKVPLSEFVQFVEALVERYDGDGFQDAPGRPIIRYWELYNEPDHSGTWGYYQEQYAQMLAAVYPAVKAADPRAMLVFGGVAYDWFEDQDGPFVRNFLEGVFNSPGGDRFDFMNYHSYAAFSAFWTDRGPGLLEKAQAIRQVMSANLPAPRPMMVTEAGWCSNGCTPDKPTSETFQARYVAALFTQSLAADLKVMIWWMLHDFDPDWHILSSFGLVTASNPPREKLAFYAFRTTKDQLSTARFERTWSNIETGHSMVEFYQFDDVSCGCKRYVGWLDPLETSDTAALSVPHGQVKVFESINGMQIATLKDGDDGKVDGRTRVIVTGAPRYYEGD
jgi:hypothetical protein